MAVALANSCGTNAHRYTCHARMLVAKGWPADLTTPRGLTCGLARIYYTRTILQRRADFETPGGFYNTRRIFQRPMVQPTV